MIPVLVPFSQGQLSISGAHTYATWNPSDKSANVVLTNGNLTMSTPSAMGVNSGVRSTIGKSAGKWYWEVKCTIFETFPDIGVANSSASLDHFVGFDVNGWGYRGTSGHKDNNSSNAAYGNAFVQTNVIGVALDMDNGKLFFAVTNSWQNSGDPVAGTNAAFTGLSGTLFAMVTSQYDGVAPDTWLANFGATALTYTPPTGYNAGLYT